MSRLGELCTKVDELRVRLRIYVLTDLSAVLPITMVEEGGEWVDCLQASDAELRQLCREIEREAIPFARRAFRGRIRDAPYVVGQYDDINCPKLEIVYVNLLRIEEVPKQLLGDVYSLAMAAKHRAVEWIARYAKLCTAILAGFIKVLEPKIVRIVDVGGVQELYDADSNYLESVDIDRSAWELSNELLDCTDLFNRATEVLGDESERKTIVRAPVVVEVTKE